MLYERVDGLTSIVVTCYNVAPFIEDCLDSIAEQTYKNIEVIIVDDNSQDNTIKRIKEWEKINNPGFDILIVELPRNVGFSGAINFGYFLTSGEFIAIQDGDDMSHPTRIEKQIAYLKQNPEIDLVGTNYSAFSNGSFYNQEKPNWIKYGDDILETYRNGGHCICHGTILFRGRIFDQVGGPTRRIGGAEDYEFIVKCINAEFNIANIPEELYYYRSHSSQRSRTYYKGERKLNE